jgi:MFS family permease
VQSTTGRRRSRSALSEAAAGAARFRDVLAIPDYRRLTLALTVDSAGTWASGVVLMVYVYQQTHSPTWLAVTTVVRFVPSMLFGVYGGVVAERFERTRVLITCALASYLTAIGMAIAVAAKAPVAVAVALSVTISIITTPYNPAVGALVPQIVGSDRLVAANSLQSTIENVSAIAGPAFGALLAASGRPSAAFTLNAFTFAFAALCVVGMRVRSTPTDVTERGTNPFAQMSVGFHALRELPRVRLLILLSLLATAVYGTDTVLFAPVARHLHAASDGYGYLITGLAIGGIAVAALVNRLARKTNLSLWIGVGMAAYCLPTALIPFVHNIAVGSAIQVVRGAGTVVVDVLALTALQRAVPQRLLSRVLGLFDSLLYASGVIGALVAPVLLAAASLRTTLFIAAVTAPAITVLLLPGLWRLDAEAAARLERLQPTIDLLAGLSLLRGADTASLERIAEAAERRELAANVVLVRQGDPTDGFFVVVAGEVTVTSRGETGRAVAVEGRLGAGDYFGEIGLLYDVPRTATVRTATQTTVLFVPGDVFLDTFTQSSAPGLFATATNRLARTHPTLAARAAFTESSA